MTVIMAYNSTTYQRTGQSGMPNNPLIITKTGDSLSAAELQEILRANSTQTQASKAYVIGYALSTAASGGELNQYLFFMHGEKLSCVPIRIKDKEPSILPLLYEVSVAGNALISQNERLSEETQKDLPSLTTQELVSQDVIDKAKGGIQADNQAAQGARELQAKMEVGISLPLKGCALSLKLQTTLYRSDGLLKHTPSFQSYLESLLANPDIAESPEKKLAALQALIVSGKKQDEIFQKYSGASYTMQYHTGGLTILFLSGYGISKFDKTAVLGDDAQVCKAAAAAKADESLPTIGEIFSFYQQCVQQVITTVNQSAQVPADQLRQLDSNTATAKPGDPLPELAAQQEREEEEEKYSDFLANYLFNATGVNQSFYTSEDSSRAAGNEYQAELDTYKPKIIQALHDLINVSEQKTQTPQLIENVTAYNNVAIILMGEDARTTASESMWAKIKTNKNLKDALSKLTKNMPLDEILPRPPLISPELNEKLSAFCKTITLPEISNIISAYKTMQLIIFLEAADILTQEHFSEFLQHAKNFDIMQIISLCQQAGLSNQDTIGKCELVAGSDACKILKKAGFEDDVIFQKLDVLLAVEDAQEVYDVCRTLQEAGFANGVILEKLDVLLAAKEPWGVALACKKLKAVWLADADILQELDVLLAAKDPLGVANACEMLKETGFAEGDIFQKLDVLAAAKYPREAAFACKLLKDASFPPDEIMTELHQITATDLNHLRSFTKHLPPNLPPSSLPTMLNVVSKFTEDEVKTLLDQAKAGAQKSQQEGFFKPTTLPLDVGLIKAVYSKVRTGSVVVFSLFKECRSFAEAKTVLETRLQDKIEKALEKNYMRSPGSKPRAVILKGATCQTLAVITGKSPGEIFTEAMNKANQQRIDKLYPLLKKYN